MQSAASLCLRRLNQPQSVDRLQRLLMLKLFECDFFLVPDVGRDGREEGIALNMAQPNSLPIDIARLIFFALVIGLQYDL